MSLQGITSRQNFFSFRCKNNKKPLKNVNFFWRLGVHRKFYSTLIANWFNILTTDVSTLNIRFKNPGLKLLGVEKSEVEMPCSQPLWRGHFNPKLESWTFQLQIHG